MIGRTTISTLFPYTTLFRSVKIQDVLRMIARLKDTRTPVLITGESGTGKELVARAIHFRGQYAKRPFVAVDCGSLVPTLDRKSTRLNSSHMSISYAVFCLKK